MAQENHCCNLSHPAPAVHQTFHEIEFERGIWYAAQYGDLERVKKLISNGTDVDNKDTSHYTGLHYAARNGHWDVCKLLLENGANVNAVTKLGLATALHRACLAGKVSIVQLLIKHNASLKLTDSDGKTALHRASECQNKEICKLIIDRCPELKSVPDNKGKLPGDYAQSEDLINLLQT